MSVFVVFVKFFSNVWKIWWKKRMGKMVGGDWGNHLRAMFLCLRKNGTPGTIMGLEKDCGGVKNCSEDYAWR
jgi:hypothetical protein